MDPYNSDPTREDVEDVEAEQYEEDDDQSRHDLPPRPGSPMFGNSNTNYDDCDDEDKDELTHEDTNELDVEPERHVDDEFEPTSTDGDTTHNNVLSQGESLAFNGPDYADTDWEAEEEAEEEEDSPEEVEDVEKLRRLNSERELEDNAALDYENEEIRSFQRMGKPHLTKRSFASNVPVKPFTAWSEGERHDPPFDVQLLARFAKSEKKKKRRSEHRRAKTEGSLPWAPFDSSPLNPYQRVQHLSEDSTNAVQSAPSSPAIAATPSSPTTIASCEPAVSAIDASQYFSDGEMDEDELAEYLTYMQDLESSANSAQVPSDNEATDSTQQLTATQSTSSEIPVDKAAETQPITTTALKRFTLPPPIDLTGILPPDTREQLSPHYSPIFRSTGEASEHLRKTRLKTFFKEVEHYYKRPDKAAGLFQVIGLKTFMQHIAYQNYEVERCGREIEKYEERLKQAEAYIENRDARVKELKRQVEQTRKWIANAEKHMEEREDRMEELKAGLTAAQDELSAAEDELDKSEQERDRLRERLAEMEQHFETLQTTDKDEVIFDLSGKVEELKEQNEDLKKEVEGLKAANQALLQEKEEIRQQKQAVERANENLKNKATLLDGVNEGLKKQMREQAQASSGPNEELRVERDTCRAEKATLKDECDRLKSDNDGLVLYVKEQHKAYEANKDELEKQIQELTQQLASAKQDAASKETTFTAQLQAMEEQLQAAQAFKKDLITERDRLQDENDILKVDNQCFSNAAPQYTTELEALKRENQSLRSRVALLEAQLAQPSRAPNPSTLAETISSSHTQLLQAHNHLQTRYKTKRLHVTSLQARIATLEDSLKLAESQVYTFGGLSEGTLQATINAQEALLTRIRNELESKNRDLEKLHALIESERHLYPARLIVDPQLEIRERYRTEPRNFLRKLGGGEVAEKVKEMRRRMAEERARKEEDEAMRAEARKQEIEKLAKEAREVAGRGRAAARRARELTVGDSSV